tara:strand:- start:267 stop:467 length:201 start_codon:yes stop_codon:yes gene_type:complete
MTRQKYECLSCEGTYFDKNTDGTEYFHECPEGTKDPRNENIKPEYLAKDSTDKDKMKKEGKGSKKI